jgi:DNA-directed RNA polymerase subunit RPC12/RpoP
LRHTETDKLELPYFCARCGNRSNLKVQNHLFRFRPLLGWIALPFGMTVEIVWEAPVYLCLTCSSRIRRRQQMSRVPFYGGIALAGFSLYLTFQYLDHGFDFLVLALIIFVGGFICRSILYSSADPRTIKVNRRSLILDIPGHGAFDYTAHKHATRLK